jgi:uncharacterized protein DUF3999
MRHLTRILAGFAAIPLLLIGDFDPHNWRFQRTIKTQPKADISAIVPDATLYRQSLARLNDLRIVRSGVEVPYAIRVLSGKQEEIELPATIVNKSAAPGAGVSAVIDLSGRVSHNRIRIGTSRKNFKESVRIETSDDAKLWSVANRNGLIFDVSRSDRNVSDLTLTYPVSTRRYVRITIPGWHDPAWLESAFVVLFQETDAVRDIMASGTPVVIQNSQDRSTSFQMDAGMAGLPYDRVTISPLPGFFSRAVEVLSSSDAKNWIVIGGGTLSRTAGQENLSLSFDAPWTRYLKLTVFNGDNSPLVINKIDLSGLRRMIVFASKEPGAYELFSGNASAARPSYDFAEVTPDSIDPAAATLGPPADNAQYRAPALPWTDRNPILLNTVLLLAVIVMGFVTLRYFMRVRAM